MIWGVSIWMFYIFSKTALSDATNLLEMVVLCFILPALDQFDFTLSWIDILNSRRRFLQSGECGLRQWSISREINFDWVFSPLIQFSLLTMLKTCPPLHSASRFCTSRPNPGPLFQPE